MYIVCKFSVDFSFSFHGQQYLCVEMALYYFPLSFTGRMVLVWSIYMNKNTWSQLLNCCGKVISSTGRSYNVSQQWFSLEGREIKWYWWCIWHMLVLTFSHKRFNYLKWSHSLLLHNPGPYLFSEQLQFLLLRPVVSTCGSQPLLGSHIRYLCHGL